MPASSDACSLRDQLDWFRWNFHTLIGKGGSEAVQRLLTVVMDILSHPVLLQGLQEITTLTRQDFKNESNHGFVWVDKRNIDLGNIAYSILYCMLYRYARHFKHGDVWQVLQFLETRYTTLQLKESSDNAIIMKADVIERVLYVARQSGPALSPSIRLSRQSLNALMKRYQETLVDIYRCSFVCGPGGPPRVRHMPLPDLFAKVVLMAHAVISAAGSAKYAEHVTRFDMLVSQCLSTVAVPNVQTKR